MTRVLFLFAGLQLFTALPLYAQVPADEDLRQHASALKTAYAALQRGGAAAAKDALSATKEPLRGTPFRLLKQLAANREPQHDLTGKAVPRPDDPYLLSVLHPTELQVAYLCDRGFIVVYDLAEVNAAPERWVTSRGKPLMHGSFSADGESFAVGDAEGGIVVWNTHPWNEKTSYLRGSQPVRYVSMDKSGNKVLAETEDGVVLWDIQSDREIGVVANRYNFGTSFCFSNDQTHFATGGLYGVQIHAVATGKIIREIRHAPYTMELRFSPDGRYIASGLRGSLNKWLGVFDVATGETVFDHATHEKGITGLLFLDQGKCLLSTSADGTMKFWHVPSGTELLAINLGGSIYQPSSHVDGSIILWNQRSGPRYFTAN